MYRNVKSGRVSDSLDYMEEKWKLNGQIEKLEKDLRTTQDELKAAVEEKQVILALKAKAEQALIEARAELHQKKIVEENHSNMHKVLRIQVEKQRDQLKGEKKKLEYIIADFMKQKECTRSKVRKIREICDEI
jgi:hypothetical protein